MSPPERPSAIIGDRLLLTRHGAAMVAAAIELAMKAAGANGVDYAGRTAYDDVAWLLAQARTVAAGAAAGTSGQRFTVVMPSSAPVPELLTTGQAAAIMRLSTRAVVKRIEAGQLPARKVGREWLITEYDARCAANGGRADARTTRAEDADRPGSDRDGGGRVGQGPPARP